MQWAEKYRPKCLDDIVGHDDEMKIIRGMMSNGGLPNILLIGPQGTGKTAAAHAIATQLLDGDMAGNFIERNGSDDRTYAIRKLAIEAARCLPLNGKLRVFVVDESDGLARDTQEALRHTLEHSGKTLFIFTANRKEEFIKPLLSRLTTFDFKELTPADILKRLKAICDIEGLTGAIKPTRLKLIVAKSEGDMRMAINELQKEAMLI